METVAVYFEKPVRTYGIKPRKGNTVLEPGVHRRPVDRAHRLPGRPEAPPTAYLLQPHVGG